jgi:hypothetical protein
MKKTLRSRYWNIQYLIWIWSNIVMLGNSHSSVIRFVFLNPIIILSVMLLIYINIIFLLVYLWMNYIVGNCKFKFICHHTLIYFLIFSILYIIFSIYTNNIFPSMILNEKIRSVNIIIVYQKKKLLVFLFIFVVIVNIVTSGNSHSSIEIIARIWSYTTYLSSSHTESMSISKLKKLKINSHGDILTVLIKSFPWQRFQPKHPARRTNTQDQ